MKNFCCLGFLHNYDFFCQKKQPSKCAGSGGRCFLVTKTTCEPQFIYSNTPRYAPPRYANPADTPL